MTDEPKSPNSAPNSRNEREEPQLPAFRFSLLHLFITVTLICLVLAGVVVGANFGFTSLALILASLLVAMHVAGTTIGYRLREHADQHRLWESGEITPVIVTPMPSYRPSPLHEHRASMPWLKPFVIMGFLAGGAMGAAILIWTIGHRATAAGILVGAFSTGVVGGWFAFVAGSFWSMFRQGWRDALNDDPTAPRNL